MSEEVRVFAAENMGACILAFYGVVFLFMLLCGAVARRSGRKERK